MKLFSKLWEFYREKRKDADWKRKGSEVWNLTRKMLGTEAKPTLGVKAAEARGLLEFIVGLLEESLPRVELHHRERAELLLQSGYAGLAVDKGLRNKGTVLVDAASQQAL